MPGALPGEGAPSAVVPTRSPSLPSVTGDLGLRHSGALRPPAPGPSRRPPRGPQQSPSQPAALAHGTVLRGRPLWTAMHGLGSLGLLAGLLPAFLHMHGEEAGGARGTADAHPPWPGHAGGRCLAVWGGSREPSGSWRVREARSSGQVRSGAFLKSRQMEPGPPAGRGGTACRMGPAEPGVGVLTPRSPAASGGGCVAAAGRAGRRAPGHGAGGKAGPAPSWPRLACQASFPRAGTTGLFQEHGLQVDFPRFPGLRWDPPPAPLPGAGPAASPELGRGLLTPAQGVGPLARCRPGGSSGGPPNRRQRSPPPRGPH